MATYQYEAMDNSGLEVKDSIDAGSEAEAQTKIREKGFFVTKITEKNKAPASAPPPRAVRAGQAAPAAPPRRSSC